MDPPRAFRTTITVHALLARAARKRETLSKEQGKTHLMIILTLRHHPQEISPNTYCLFYERCLINNGISHRHFLSSLRQHTRLKDVSKTSLRCHNVLKTSLSRHNVFSGSHICVSQSACRFVVQVTVRICRVSNTTWKRKYRLELIINTSLHGGLYEYLSRRGRRDGKLFLIARWLSQQTPTNNK